MSNYHRISYFWRDPPSSTGFFWGPVVGNLTAIIPAERFQISRGTWTHSHYPRYMWWRSSMIYLDLILCILYIYISYKYFYGWNWPNVPSVFYLLLIARCHQHLHRRGCKARSVPRFLAPMGGAAAHIPPALQWTLRRATAVPTTIATWREKHGDGFVWK